jgi:hypothetical protein
MARDSIYAVHGLAPGLEPRDADHDVADLVPLLDGVPGADQRMHGRE